jgi:uncharacterized protein with NRDE domain
MCTVTWFRSSDGYELLCNRDELRTRLPEAAPLQHDRSGVNFLAPLDGNHAGTWITVNHFRVSFCLLNGYVPAASPGNEKKPYRSRGHLVFDLVDSASLMEARERVIGSCLEQYQPFTLIVLEPDKPALLLDWTGRQLLHQINDERLMLLVSSSYDQRGAEIARRNLFNKMKSEQGQSDAEWVHTFHASHLPYRGPYSPCMHREDASTISFSSVKVAGDRIEFTYFPGSPCELIESAQSRRQGKSSQTLVLPTADELIEVR